MQSHHAPKLVILGREHFRLGGHQHVEVDERQPLALEAARELAAHDRQEPGFGPVLVLQRVERLPGPQHRLLNHVFGQLPVPAQPEGESQQVGAQALAQGPKTLTAVHFSVPAVHV